MIPLESDPGFISCDVYCAAVAITHSSAHLHNTTTPPLLPLETTDSLERPHPIGKGRLMAMLMFRSVTWGRVRFPVRNKKRIHQKKLSKDRLGVFDSIRRSGGYRLELFNKNFTQISVKGRL